MTNSNTKTTNSFVFLALGWLFITELLGQHVIRPHQNTQHTHKLINKELLYVWPATINTWTLEKLSHPLPINNWNLHSETNNLFHSIISYFYFLRRKETHKVCKMNFQKMSSLFIIFVITVAILGHAPVQATRLLREDFAAANHLETYSSPSSLVYEKAKYTMECWLQRLASGPSPKGPGH